MEGEIVLVFDDLWRWWGRVVGYFFEVFESSFFECGSVANGRNCFFFLVK